jgi:hypothetical protein
LALVEACPGSLELWFKLSSCYRRRTAFINTGALARLLTGLYTYA